MVCGCVGLMMESEGIMGRVVGRVRMAWSGIATLPLSEMEEVEGRRRRRVEFSCLLFAVSFVCGHRPWLGPLRS